MIVKVVFAKDSTDVEVCDEATVAMLHKAIEEQMDVPVHKQKLICKGKVMAEKSQLLSKYNVGNGGKVMLMASGGLTQGQVLAKQQAAIRRQQADKRMYERTSAARDSGDVPQFSKAADSMPERIKRWKATGVMSLRELQLTEFPAGFEEALTSMQRDDVLTNITFADVGNNMLQTLPGAISQLVGLKRLRCSQNRLTADGMPWNVLPGLSQLTCLSLDHNSMARLDPALCKVTSLQALDVSSNALEILPEGLNQLQSLVFLNVGCNKLRALPDCLECGNLVALEAHTNSISQIPESFSSLQALKSLKVANNRIAAVPSAVLAGCSELHALDVRDNPVTMQQLRETVGYKQFEDRRKVRLDKIVGAKIGADFWEAADYDAYHRH